MAKWKGLNKRQFPRIKYPCLIVIRNNDSSDDSGSTVLAHTDNVGVGGVCVLLRQSVKTFSVVKLELDLLDLENHICCDGKVVWNVERKSGDENKLKMYDVGIEFMNIAEEDQARLEKVLDRLIENEV